MIRKALVVGILTLASAPVQGAGLRGLDGGWLLEGPESGAVLAPSSPEQVEGRAWWIGVGLSRLFGMEDLPVSGVAWGFAARRWSTGMAWQRVGRTLFVEDRAEAFLRWGRNPRLGVRVAMGRWSVRGFETGQAWDPALELTLGTGTPWSVRLTWHLADPPGWHGRTGRRELARASWIQAGVGVAVVLDRNPEGVPAVGFQGLWRLDRRIAVGMRADPVTGSLGPCLAVSAGVVMIRSSHLVHPALGPTHRFMLDLGDVRAAVW